MLLAGKNIKSANDPLVKVEVRYLYDAIRNPKPKLSSLIKQLRIIRQLNSNQYRILKTQLPYVVCGVFNPPYRKIENFAYTQYFIIDLDHLAEKGVALVDLRKKIMQDQRTVLCFVSPSGDGLKVMFKLNEKCYDAGRYKTFYQTFLAKYSKAFGLQQVVDSKTCDVARACFLSVDDNACFNPQAEMINMSEYLDPDVNMQMAMECKHEVEKDAKEGDKLRKEEMKCSADPSDDIFQQIRNTLNPKAKGSIEKMPAYVPEVLNDLADALHSYISKTGIVVQEIININYAKKIRVKIGTKLGEVNLFYGKRGFSVVQSPRTGTDTETNELLADVIRSFLIENT